MRRLRLTGIVCSLLAALLPATAREPGNSPPLVTIDELVAQALHNHAELRFYEAEIAAAKGQRKQSGLWRNPEFSGEYGSRRVSDNSGVLQGEGYTRSFAMTQTFEFPGKGSLRKAIAEKDIKLAELGLKQFRLVLEGRVRSLALQHLAFRANADAAGEIDERSTGLVKLLRERPTGGVQQLLELRVIEGSLLETQRSAKEFVLNREESRIELNCLVGRPASQPISIQEKLEMPSWPDGDLNRLILSGLANNYQLRIRTVELEKAVKGVAAAKLEMAPDFAVGPFFSQDKAGDLEENFGASVAVTLPLWNWNQGNIAIAEAKQVQADAMILDARRKVEAAIARSFRAYELNRKHLEQISANTLEQLREASDLADRQYRTGGIGVQLFLEVQREYLNARKIRNEAVVEAWKNRLDLELLLGGAGVRVAAVKGESFRK